MSLSCDLFVHVLTMSISDAGGLETRHCCLGHGPILVNSPSVVCALNLKSNSQSISDAGGWETDTVVEDMDLSLRAYLAGWRGLYLPHVGCVNEVPDDLSTYKTQQYRYVCVCGVCVCVRARVCATRSSPRSDSHCAECVCRRRQVVKKPSL